MTLFRVDPSKDLLFSFSWTNWPVRTYPVYGGLRSDSKRAVHVLGRAVVVAVMSSASYRGSRSPVSLPARSVDSIVRYTAFW